MPVVAVITNIEADHLDTYRDLDDIRDAFTAFANRVPFYGAVIACVDEPGVAAILPRIKRRVVTYGESSGAAIAGAGDSPGRRGHDLRGLGGGNRGPSAPCACPCPGRHNVANALAAIAVGRELSVPFPTIARALAEFTGVVRRFETKGERDGVLVVDDYAHHPTEMTATLASARQVYPGRRIVALFQPHLYSRTVHFAPGFGQALTGCDIADRHGRLPLAGKARWRG